LRSHRHIIKFVCVICMWTSIFPANYGLKSVCILYTSVYYNRIFIVRLYCTISSYTGISTRDDIYEVIIIIHAYTAAMHDAIITRRLQWIWGLTAMYGLIVCAAPLWVTLNSKQPQRMCHAQKEVYTVIQVTLRYTVKCVQTTIPNAKIEFFFEVLIFGQCGVQPLVPQCPKVESKWWVSHPGVKCLN